MIKQTIEKLMLIDNQWDGTIPKVQCLQVHGDRDGEERLGLKEGAVVMCAVLAVAATWGLRVHLVFLAWTVASLKAQLMGVRMCVCVCSDVARDGMV